MRGVITPLMFVVFPAAEGSLFTLYVEPDAGLARSLTCRGMMQSRCDMRFKTMSLTRFLTAAAVSALFAAPAFAGPDPAQPATTPADQRQSSDTQSMNPPSADQAATPASATIVDPSAPAIILRSSPTPPEDAWKLKAGDPNVVTNGPVPDTAENRARYGAPLSNGGRRTKPVGN